MNEKELYERQISNQITLRGSDVALGRREAALLGWICRHLNGDSRESQFRFAELSTGLRRFLSDSDVLKAVGLDKVFASVDAALAAFKPAAR